MNTTVFNESMLMFVPSCYLLKGACDDEIGVIHRNKISCKLGREMVFFVKLFPVDIGIRILRFLQRVGDGALQKAKNTVKKKNVSTLSSKLMEMQSDI